MIIVPLNGKKVLMEESKAQQIVIRYDRLVPEMERLYPTLQPEQQLKEARRRVTAWALGLPYAEPRWLRDLRSGGNSDTVVLAS